MVEELRQTQRRMTKLPTIAAQPAGGEDQLARLRAMTTAPNDDEKPKQSFAELQATRGGREVELKTEEFNSGQKFLESHRRSSIRTTIAKAKEKGGEKAAAAVEAAVVKRRCLTADTIMQTSVRLVWDPPVTSFPISGYRCSLAIVDRNKQRPFEVAIRDTGSSDCEAIVVNMQPATTYKFQCAALHRHEKKGMMMVNGSTLQSNRVSTKPLRYMKAWLFEDLEEVQSQWRLYFGEPYKSENPEKGGGLSTKEMRALDPRVLAVFSVSQTNKVRFTGICCMKINCPGEVGGGAYVDFAIKASRTYRVVCKVKQICGATGVPTDAKGGTLGAKLILWNHESEFSVSEPAEKEYEWQSLEVGALGGEREPV